MEPIELLPECFMTEEYVNMLDSIFDQAASNSHWTNEEVAWAICRILHLICGDGKGEKHKANW